MTEIELLEHVLNNRKEGRPASEGLMFRGGETESVSAHGIVWHSAEDYELEPEMHTINGFEVPKPYKGEMRADQRCCVADTHAAQFYSPSFWKDVEHKRRLQARGLVFLNARDAVANAKAMLGIDPYLKAAPVAAVPPPVARYTKETD